MSLAASALVVVPTAAPVASAPTTFTVPSGICSVIVGVVGGTGGSGGGGAAGSQGDGIHATFAVNPGDVLTINPGAAGAAGGNGSPGSSGTAGSAGGTPAGGAGG